MARGSFSQNARIALLLSQRLARSALARASQVSFGAWHILPGRTDRLLIAPQELRTADATRAAEIYAGRFVFAGKIVTCHGRSPFDIDPPSEEWLTALTGFGWLRHLRAAESAITKANARSLVDEWMGLRGRMRAPPWRPEVQARRIMSFLSQASLLLQNADGRFYRRFLRGLTREIQYLRATLVDVPDGLARLQAAIALSYASLCLAQQARAIPQATRRLADELQRQILADGGHVSRNPAATIELLLDLLPLRQTFAARNVVPPAALLNAIDRMMLMLRSFRHGDGQLALFNGMSATPTDQVATVLAYDDDRGAPMANMPHSGYQRLDAGTVTVLVDTGLPPPPALSQDAHAGCLSFEMSSGIHRIIVNCGVPPAGRDGWHDFARATSAHSTLCFHETSSCEFIGRGAMKRLLHGAPIISGPTNVEARRENLAEGVFLTAMHDGYARHFDIVHRRTLMLANDGARLSGEDTLIHRGGALPHADVDDYAIRFHLHPAIKVSRLGEGRGALLILPNREAWTFEAPDDKVELAESVYLAGSDGPRKSVQIVVRQHARAAPSVRWMLTRSTTTPSATAARHKALRQPELPL